MRLGDGKSAARVNAAANELHTMNQKLSELQAERMKLASSLATLEVYAQRDALSVSVSAEKLDEFVYM